MEDLTQSFYKVSEKLYQQNGGAQGQGFDPNNMGGANAGAGATNNNDDNVVDADFEVQDDK